MKYIVIYADDGIWYYQSQHEDNEDALREIRRDAARYPARHFEIHPVHPTIALMLINGHQLALSRE